MFGINNKEDFLKTNVAIRYKNKDEAKQILKLLEDNFKDMLWCNGSNKPTQIDEMYFETGYILVDHQKLYGSRRFYAEDFFQLSFYEFDSLIAWFNKPILDEVEKKYLWNIVKPFKRIVNCIIKLRDTTSDSEYIRILIQYVGGMYKIIDFPNFAKNSMYKGMKLNTDYTLEKLGLIEPKKKKITLKAFFESRRALAIHCDTEEKANKLLNAFDKLGKKWASGNSYLFDNFYRSYKQNTCYTNDRCYADCDWCQKEDYKIFEFDEVDLEN